MRAFAFVIILIHGIGLAAGAAAPFIYCLDSGELCCSGWNEQVCCDEASAAGLENSGSCSDLVVATPSHLVPREVREGPGPSGDAIPVALPPTVAAAPKLGSVIAAMSPALEPPPIFFLTTSVILRN